MIRIGILGDIGSGKSFIAKKFGYPVFNADEEVGKLYKNNRNVFRKLKKILPKYINTFPVKKNEISEAILSEKKNLKKIVKIIHLEIRKKMNSFIKKNKNKEIIILDVPLLLENKINRKKDLLIFVETKKKDVLKRLKKRKGYNSKLIRRFKKIQLPLAYKKKKSHFLVKNNFTSKYIKKDINNILKKILI